MNTVNIVNKSNNPLPEYKTLGAAGADLRAYLPEGDVVMQPNSRVLVPTGLFIELPLGQEAQIRPRSGFAVKEGVTVLNSPGTIDADYRGEIKVILYNSSAKAVVIKSGDRVCQMVIAKHEQPKFKVVKELNSTVRGEDGFGSTGKK